MVPIAIHDKVANETYVGTIDEVFDNLHSGLSHCSSTVHHLVDQLKADFIAGQDTSDLTRILGLVFMEHPEESD